MGYFTLTAQTTIALEQYSEIRTPGSGLGADNVNCGPNTYALVLIRRIDTTPVQAATFVEQQASGVSGGDSTEGTFVARTLTAMPNNTITGASLSSGKMSLPAGTYEASVAAQCWQAGAMVARLRRMDTYAVVLRCRGHNNGRTVTFRGS